MPMDRSKYPSNWDEIAIAIKERDGWRCRACGVEHNARIVRNGKNWWYATADDTEHRPSRIIRIILTVHHSGIPKPDGTPGDPEDKMDCRPENLVTLCQLDHLHEDRDRHIQKSAETRARKKQEARLEAGQGELFS